MTNGMRGTEGTGAPVVTRGVTVSGEGRSVCFLATAAVLFLLCTALDRSLALMANTREEEGNGRGEGTSSPPPTPPLLSFTVAIAFTAPNSVATGDCFNAVV